MLLESLSLDRGLSNGQHPHLPDSQQGRSVLALLAIALCPPRSGKPPASGAQSKEVVMNKVRGSAGITWPCRQCCHTDLKSESQFSAQGLAVGVE